jgi:cyclopropane fatty-acyl-phospholipid synthase-like methyltransferase
MKSYWERHYDINSQEFGNSLLKQVGKTVNGQEVSEDQVKLIIDNVINALRLNSSDVLMDLCCGNGVITRQLAPLVKDVIGVDFSHGLIDAAERCNGFHNIRYFIADVLRLDQEFLLRSNKVLMYEALQLFSVEQFVALLNKFRPLRRGTLILLGSIPNKQELGAFYDTDDKLAFYLKSENEGKPHMGRWWLMDEIERLVPRNDFEVAFLPQTPSLYTAYYRFDVLLEKRQ